MIENVVASYLTKFFKMMDSISLKNFTRRYIREGGKKRKRIQALLYGVVTYYYTLRRVAQSYLGEKFDRFNEKKQMLILVFLYRILYQSIIPEAVRKDVILKPLAKASFPSPIDDIDEIVIKTSFPRWIIEKLVRYMSLKEIEEYFSALNKRQPTYILVNPMKYEPEEAADYLKIEGVETEVDKDFPEILRIVRTTRSLHRTYLYKEGALLPMSKSSFAVVKALNPKEGDVITDVCAAPGIKTIATYFLCRGECEIYAYDIDEARLNRMRELLNKYEIKDISIERGDAREIKLKEDTNKVLIDAPCTSTGMIPDSPDIKLRVNEDVLEEFANLQKNILNNIISQLKSGRELIYSTCSIFPEEGEKQIIYLKENFNIETIKLEFGEKPYLDSNIGIRFYPNKNNTIGMFIAKMRVL